MLKKETEGHKTGVNQSRGAVDQNYLNKESGEKKKYKRKSGNLKKYTKITTIKEGNKLKEWKKEDVLSFKKKEMK